MPHDRHPEDVKAALRKAGTSLAILAREHSVTKSLPSIALRRSFPKWEGIIAAALGEDPRAVWPERFAIRDADAARRAKLSAELAADRAIPRRLGRPPIRKTPDAAATAAGQTR